MEGSEGAAHATRRIPDFLRQLREPWLTDVPPGRLAGFIRFAASIAAHDGQKRVVQYTSGGAGTIIEEPLDDETYAAVEGLIAREYFEKLHDSEAGGAREALEGFLASRDVELVVSSKRVPRGAYEFAREILELLPEGHVGSESFRALELGGWGHGAAKCSEYEEGAVRMFSFAVKGPRRNFAALLLHETGHAYFAGLAARDPSAEAELRRLHSGVVRFSPVADFHTELALMPFAVDYLMGVQSRVNQTLSDPHEFAAEVYVIYVVRGVEMRELIAALPSGLRRAWAEVHEAYRGFFGGVEYE